MTPGSDGVEQPALAPLDALMLKGDAEARSRAVMTGALLLERPPDWARLVARVERATRAVPRMRQRVVAPLLPLGPPEWVVDDDFDLGYHLRRVALPQPGDVADALHVGSAAATAPFDPARPLWEATLVEGLADGLAVLLIRAHHALTDGVGAMEMMQGLLDLEADPVLDELAAPAPGARRTPASLFVRRVLSAPVDAATASPRRTMSSLRMAWQLSMTPATVASRAAAYGSSVARLLATAGASPSAAMRQRSRVRRFAAVDVPLDAMRAAAKDAGCTVNDVYLAGLLGGFRRYHEQLGLEPVDVPLALPINMRDLAGSPAGNQISVMAVPGPASIADPVARIRAVNAIVSARRGEPGLDVSVRLAPVLQHLPAALTMTGLTAHARRVDLQASNLVGASVATYLAGCAVQRLYPFGPLPGIPVMVVLLSYDGVCCLGITLDPAAVTEPDVFVECVRAGLAEVVDDRGAVVTVASPR